jgi:hypothetical protein
MGRSDVQKDSMHGWISSLDTYVHTRTHPQLILHMGVNPSA